MLYWKTDCGIPCCICAEFSVFQVVGELASCGELLKGDSWTDPSDPTAVAENELIGAANSIEAAAVKLFQLRPRQTQVKVKLKLCVFKFNILLWVCYMLLKFFPGLHWTLPYF